MDDPKKQLSAGETATEVLREYREHRETFRMFDDFDEAMSGMRMAIERDLGTVAEPLKTVGGATVPYLP